MDAELGNVKKGSETYQRQIFREEPGDKAAKRQGAFTAENKVEHSPSTFPDFHQTFRVIQLPFHLSV